MKKKLFIGTVLPTIAALGVIGSGFSLWIFSDSNSATAEGSLSTNVENVVTIGNLTNNYTKGTNAMTLVFDQSKNVVDSEGTATATLNTRGESVHFDNDATINAAEKVTYTWNADNKHGDESYQIDYEEGKTEVTFTTTITVPSDIASYVTLSYTDSLGQTMSTSDEGLTYTYTILASQISDFSTAKATGIVVFNWENMSVSYKNGKEPTNLTDYKTMKSKVEAAGSITTAYSAVVSIK